MAQVQKLPVSSSYDKRPIDAWMVTPPDFDPAKRYPMILEIHGGPFAAYGPQFSTDDQLYASAGYVVLYTNPRGSTSYGEEFANQIDKAYPGHDYDDLMSAVDAAIASGHVDPNNLFVTGGSGGGVLTAWIVGKTDRFRAAATQKPVIDWASFGLTSDIATFLSPYWFAKKPWEDPTGYWARSPLSLVGNVKTPTLVVVGARTTARPTARPSNIMRRCSCAAFRPRSSKCPARATAESPPGRARPPPRPARSSPGSTATAPARARSRSRPLKGLPRRPRTN